MACPFAALDAQPSHPFASRPKHPPLGSSASSHASSSGSSCPFSSKGEAGSTRPSATYIPPLSDPSPLSDSVSLLPPHPTAAPSSTLSSLFRLPDVLPAGPQPSRLTASHPLRPPSAALHSALHGFRALNASYAYEEYSEAFNWSELDLGLETEGVWWVFLRFCEEKTGSADPRQPRSRYCVAFRSKRMLGTENDLALYEADKAAHEEALEQGQSSLLLYWYGRPDAHGVNLATCIWEVSPLPRPKSQPDG